MMKIKIWKDLDAMILTLTISAILERKEKKREKKHARPSTNTRFNTFTSCDFQLNLSVYAG